MRTLGLRLPFGLGERIDQLLGALYGKRQHRGREQAVTHGFVFDEHAVAGGLAGVAELAMTDIEGALWRTASLLQEWRCDAELIRSACMETAEARRPLVEAVLDRWLPELQRELSWPQWTFVFGDNGETGFDKDRFGTPEGMQHDFSEGQFPWGWAWSFTPTDASPDLILDKWELDDRILTVAELTTSSQPRIAVVNGVEDWADLIRANPGRQTRTGLAPDWASIAERYDAVHLTWWGFVTLFVNREATDRHGVIPLETWSGQQTLWLNADKLVFGRRFTLTGDD